MHRDAKLLRRSQGAALLAPFDLLICERSRAERLFGFHYRIEIYVPQDERTHGYYVLPFLLDEALIGRVDLKADPLMSRVKAATRRSSSASAPARKTI
nr:crosslink repair DNA glycosylase YcaQ family protein [Sphingobium yanoikuyae]